MKRLFSHKFRCLSCTAEYQPWVDMATARANPLCRLVPAQKVFFFSNLESTSQAPSACADGPPAGVECMLTEWADTPIETLMIRFKEITADVKHMLLSKDRSAIQQMLADLIEKGKVREYWFRDVPVPRTTMEYPAWINESGPTNQRDPWTLPQSVVETGRMRGAVYRYTFGDAVLNNEDLMRIFATTQGLLHTMMTPPSAL